MNSNKKSSIISLILLLLLVGTGIFWFKPNWDETSALKVTERAREAEKNQAADELKLLQDAQASLAGTGEVEQQTVLSAIPERYEQDKLITLIADIAKKNDVNIGSVSFSIAGGTSDLVKKSTISLSMTGNKSDLIRLLKGLESSSRKLVVKGITVQFGKTEGLDRVNFSISMDVFYQKGL